MLTKPSDKSHNNIEAESPAYTFDFRILKNIYIQSGVQKYFIWIYDKNISTE